jgi:DNA-binding transcriptional LysR family regulator
MDIEKLDWTLLRSFLAVIDQGSLLAAARHLGTYQPTLSRQIGELESQLGMPLFERTGRGLAATAAGLAIVDAARRMAAAAADVQQALRGTRTSNIGRVRVSASQVVANFLMPSFIAAFRVRNPGIEIDLVSSNAVSNLLRREADIAIRMARPTQSSLIARRLGECPLGAFAAQAYLQRRGVPRRLSDLAKHDLLGLDRDDDLLRGLQRAGVMLSREAFSVRTDDQVAYARLVEEGAGIGFLAEFTARRLPAVQAVLPRLATASMPLWLVVHREIRGSALIRAVYDALADDLPPRLA